jgi:hypothetical protein
MIKNLTKLVLLAQDHALIINICIDHEKSGSFVKRYISQMQDHRVYTIHC